MDSSAKLVFHRRTPAILVVDDFYRQPDEIRERALALSYAPDERYFKGLRSQPYLLPFVKEEFERLLGVRVTDWLAQPMNGVFQKTTSAEPLVWHSDTQSYAAAIYLTPGPKIQHPAERGRLITSPERVGAGTSFWRDFMLGHRRPSPDPAVNAEMYSEFNLTHPGNWELVDRVGSVYNRLVLWDAQLIHSATSYERFTAESPRLVQLFFFNVDAGARA